MNKLKLLLLLLILLPISANALSYVGKDGQRGHRDDFEAVLPFIWDGQLDEWGRCITGNLDRFFNNEVPEYGGLSTYQYFKQNYGLSCKVGDHRTFFHWGYQTKPWNDEILNYLPASTVNDPTLLSEFKRAVTNEQARRNRLANAATEKVLGFGSRGVQAAYANAFVAIIYDVHILGDYETKTTYGLAKVSTIVAEICTNINRIDKLHSKELVSKLRRIGNSEKDDRQKALETLQCLRENLPQFIYNADDGRVNMREHFVKKGFQFKPNLVSDENSTTHVSSIKTKGSNSLLSVPDDGMMPVAVTKSGRYHRLGCKNLNKAKNPTQMTLNEAKARGIPAAKCCFK